MEQLATEQQMLARDGKVDITVGQAFGEFYKHEGAHYAAPRNVYYTLKQFADFFSEGRVFSSLTPADINRYIYAAQESGSKLDTTYLTNYIEITLQQIKETQQR